MSFESDILTALVASPFIAAFCPSERIFFGTMPRGVGEPFVLCTRVSTSPANTFDQGRTKTTRLDNIQLQVTCYTRTQNATLTLAEACRDTLERLAIPRCMMKDQRSDYDDFPDLFGQFCTFTCWHPSYANGAFIGPPIVVIP
jgi:hypothetical protein